MLTAREAGSRSTRGRVGAALAAAALLGLTACGLERHVPIPGVSDTARRPENTRLVDFLVQDGSIAKLNSTLLGRHVRVENPYGLTFTGEANVRGENAPLLAGSAVERELKALKTCLLRGWPGHPPDVDLIILSNLSPGAEALPNEIAIHIGLLVADDVQMGEIAFVMAHELSHVLLDHYTRKEFLDEQKEIAQGLAQAGIIAAYTAELRPVRSGKGYDLRVRDSAQVARSTAIALAAFNSSQVLADGLVESAWSRIQESEADQLAHDLLQNVGLSPEFGFVVLDRQKTFASGRKTRLEEYATDLERSMEEAIGKGDVNSIVKSTAENLGKAANAALKDAYDYFDADHPSPEQRSEDLDRYRTKLTPRDEVATPPPCDLAGLERSLETTPVRRAERALRAADLARTAVRRGDLKTAQAQVAIALDGPLARHPTTRLAAHAAARAANNSRLATQHLEAIPIDRNTPSLVFVLLAQEYRLQGRLNEASTVLDKGERKFPPDLFLPSRLQIAFAAQDHEGFARHAARCRASAYENVRATCKEVIENRNQLFTSAPDTRSASPFDALLPSLQKLF